MRHLPRILFWTLIPAGFSGVIAPAYANGFGEQTAPAFRFSNQVYETYRIQLGTSVVSTTSSLAVASKSTGSTSSLGSAQSSNMLNNVVQITNNASYNIQLNGSSNYLNFNMTVDAQQTSQGSSMTSSNTGTSFQSAAQRKPIDATYLNR